ncbi:MAG TPA: hypothetical protein VG755_13630 [Nannocystaceae bacterium]|nr:hypothetical protein [Nannocystaceae bacterium]
MAHRSAPTLVLALAVALLGSLHCHRPGEGVGWDGPLVGGPCGHDHDCFERCVEGGDFPDGTCTTRCDYDGNCPDGTVCIEKAGGVCLLPCAHDEDCRPGYDCDDTRRKGAGGDALVCIHS